MAILYRIEQAPQFLGGGCVIVLAPLNGNGRGKVNWDGRGARHGIWRGLRVLDRQIVNFLHMHFEMVGPLEHLPARFTGMRNESALMLMPHVSQQSAFQIENTRAQRALKLGSVSIKADSFLIPVNRAGRCSSGPTISKCI
jgi:hypothetical protein